MTSEKLFSNFLQNGEAKKAFLTHNRRKLLQMIGKMFSLERQAVSATVMLNNCVVLR